MCGTAATFAKVTYLFFCLALLPIGCENRKSPAPECYYETVKTLAEVTNMKPHPEGNGRISIILDFKASKLALQDQELGQLKKLHIDHDFVVRNNIEIGNKYEVEVSELVKGECEIKETIAFLHSFD